jgi:hypothetical protein
MKPQPTPRPPLTREDQVLENLKHFEMKMSHHTEQALNSIEKLKAQLNTENNEYNIGHIIHWYSADAVAGSLIFKELKMFEKIIKRYLADVIMKSTNADVMNEDYRVFVNGVAVSYRDTYHEQVMRLDVMNSSSIFSNAVGLTELKAYNELYVTMKMYLEILNYNIQ